MLSVCLGTRLKLCKKLLQLLLAESYQCFSLFNISGRCMYIYENCMSVVANKQNLLDTKAFKQWEYGPLLLLFKYELGKYNHKGGFIMLGFFVVGFPSFSLSFFFNPCHAKIPLCQ